MPRCFVSLTECLRQLPDANRVSALSQLMGQGDVRGFVVAAKGTCQLRQHIQGDTPPSASLLAKPDPGQSPRATGWLAIARHRASAPSGLASCQAGAASLPAGFPWFE